MLGQKPNKNVCICKQNPSLICRSVFYLFKEAIFLEPNPCFFNKKNPSGGEVITPRTISIAEMDSPPKLLSL